MVDQTVNDSGCHSLIIKLFHSTCWIPDW